MICIPKPITEKLKLALTNGDLPLEKLLAMSDSEAHTVLESFVGDKFATIINAELEKAKISNQNSALEKWVQNTFDPQKPALKEKAFSKIKKLDTLLNPDGSEDFMRDLVAIKLGINITSDEALNIRKMFQEVEAKKLEIPSDSPIGSTERLAYGNAVVNLKDYLSQLSESDKKLPLKEQLKPANWLKLGRDALGTIKSVLASLDNSFFGRQGLKTLYTNPDIWASGFLKSWGDIGKQLVSGNDFLRADKNGLTFNFKKIFSPQDDAVLRAIRAEIFSRPNAINGKYSAARNGYGLSVDTEEAYPVAAPERIPILGRLFKASEAAFNGGALRLRADLADRIIADAEKNGVDTLDRDQASSLGALVSSMTGRGEIGKLAAVGKELNVLLFSVRFLKSNLDTLLAVPNLAYSYATGDKTNRYAKKQAAYNFLKIITSMATILTIAKVINPNSVDLDPRSTTFGKIKTKNHTIDISAGLGGLLTLAARLVPTKHNGKWGEWEKTSTGKWTQLNTGGFGMPTGLDVLHQFIEGKASPATGVVLDLLKGQNYNNQKPTLKNEVGSLVTPIPIQNYEQMKDPGSAESISAMILDALGFSETNLTPPKKKK